MKARQFSFLLIIMAVVVSAMAMMTLPIADYATESTLSALELQWLSEHPVIKVAPDLGYAPIESLNKGHLEGIAIDYLNWMEQHYPIKFEYVLNETWAKSIAEIKAGEIDLLSAAAQTPDRSVYMNFTEPFFETPTVILRQTDASSVVSEQAFLERNVGSIKGYAVQEFLRIRYPNLQITSVDNIEQGLNDLVSGKIDLMVVESSQASYYISQLKLSNLTIERNYKVDFPIKLSMASRKDLPELAIILNKMLKSMPASEKQAIEAKWIGVNLIQGIPASFFYGLLFFFAISLFISLSVVLLNQSLKNKVREKSKALDEDIQIRLMLEQQLEDMINAIPYPMYAKNLSKSYLWANPAFSNLIGLQISQIIGKDEAVVEGSFDNATFLTCRNGDDDLLQGNCNKVSFKDCVFKAPTGYEYVFDIEKIRIKSIDSKHDFIMGIMIDTTQRVLAEREFSALNQELEAKVERRTMLLNETNKQLELSMYNLQLKELELTNLNTELEASLINLQLSQRKLVEIEKIAALGHLVASVAHEINTPLGNAILTASYIHKNTEEISDKSIEYGTKLNPFKTYIETMRESSDILSRNLNRVATLVNRFKALAVKNLETDAEIINLEQLASECFIQQKLNKDFEWHIESSLPSNFLGIRVAYEEIINNLISNALNHAFPEASDQILSIKIRLEPYGEGVRISFSDNGMGVSDDVFERMMEPLFTTKRSGSSGGIGLNVISNLLTYTLGGQIHFDRQQNCGLIVIVEVSKVDWC